MKLGIMGVDITVLGVIVAAGTNILPALAALLGVIWYGIVIYDRLKYGPKYVKDDD